MEASRRSVILVADDNKEDRARLRRYLESGGYEVREAVGGLEAMAIAEDPSTRIDLLITDVRMPHLNGSELAQRIGTLRPDLKVLFVSGFSLEILALLKLHIDKSTLVNKSIDSDTFLAKVRQYLSEAPIDSDRQIKKGSP